MSRNLRYAAVAGAVALVGGCAEKTLTGPVAQEPVRPFTAVELRVGSAATDFGVRLLHAVHAAEPKPNVLVSPLSVSMALGMTLNGAVGGTFEDMRRTLGFDMLEEAQINEAFRGLIAQLRARDPKVEFRLANAVWHKRTFQVKPPFLAAVRDYFDAQVAALDFRDPAAPRTISRWAERQTGGRIRNLVNRIDPLDRMILVNAVYFKAPWTLPFEPHATRTGPFRRADGSTVQVPLMTADRVYAYYRDAEVQLVELPYADTAFSMVLLGPAGNNTLDVVAAALTPRRWHDWMAQLEPGRLMLTLPRFSFEYELELRRVLTVLGMGVAFQPRVANFTRIADLDDLHISKVQHKAFIDVHELGTEAAAATSVTVSITSMPPELRFDRPFIFAIRERSSGTLLFVGRVGDPSVR
jgi:serpin B